MGCVAPTSSDLRKFRTALLRWYRAHGRHDLPWRHSRDPYAIYISEIMLQQTQVETVRVRFYPQFLRKFPTMEALAKADSESVLSTWQGLGYYRRARHLHAAANQAGGVMPTTVEGLMALPGIGRNTAHAVAAFAYHAPVAVMEANVKRVLCRMFALSKPSDAELWQKAELLLNHKQPFDHNQAMMDMGSMICTVRAPQCDICPAASFCQGKSAPTAYPAAPKKKTLPVRRRHIILKMNRSGNILATARRGEFLHGLYHFYEQDDAPGKAAKKIGDITQVYSHFKLEASVYIKRTKTSAEADYYSVATLRRLPMSMAEKKILQLVSGHGTSVE